ncbi:hypothetical protein vseg_003554 [Gypsophila vaccaria]
MAKADSQFGKFMEVVKNFQVTIPFTELLSQVPSNAEFMKEVLTKKREFDTLETVAFMEECSALLQNRPPPPKKKDPGFSILCTIGTIMNEKALYDHGANVSVMPLAIFLKLNMGSLK